MMARIRKIMSKPVITITPHKTVREAANLMADRDIECLVVAWGDRAIGIITEKDLVRKVIAENLPYNTDVYQVMSKPLITINSDAHLDEAREKMKKYGISRLPVEDEGKLVGIVTVSDISE
ncbi:MAG: CBS domain-containing protein [Candidatus Bathyarchaeia archaeon]